MVQLSTESFSLQMKKPLSAITGSGNPSDSSLLTLTGASFA